jgi:DNA-binding IclR family transcriptional regulator
LEKILVKSATSLARKKTVKAVDAETGAKSFVPGDGVAAVDRALTILGTFKDGETSISLATIAARTGLYKSTILRLIASLEREGYVRRQDNGQYQLGPAPLRLGMLYQQQFKLENYVLPVLRSLVAETNESGSFYVREGDHRVCLFRVDSPQAVRDHVQLGALLSLDRGAGGHVLVEFGDKAPNTLHRRGRPFVFASFGERQADTAAVAVPVFGHDNKLLGALGVSGPKVRFTKQAVARMKTLLLTSARNLTEKLGGNADIIPSEAE